MDVLTFHDSEGAIEGVRYNQLNVVLVNAIKELTQKVGQLEAGQLEAILQSQTDAIHRLEASRRLKHLSSHRKAIAHMHRAAGHGVGHY